MSHRTLYAHSELNICYFVMSEKFWISLFQNWKCFENKAYHGGVMTQNVETERKESHKDSY